jgi:hypothetical protein
MVLVPDGLIDPPVPAEAVMPKVYMAKVADMVWFAVTPLKLYAEMAPCGVLSTVTLLM